MVTVTAHIKAKKGMEDKIKEELLSLVDPTPGPGKRIHLYVLRKLEE